MSDNYEFLKSTSPQGLTMESPYVKKDWNYVNDINSGIYSNNGLTLVQFDLSSIYNSTALLDGSQCFLTIPLCLVSAYTSDSTGTLVAPTSATSPWATHGLKNGYWQMLHGADLIVNGKTIEQFQPNINAYITFKMLSQMSQDDLKTFGTSLGMGDCLDNIQSMKFNGQPGMSASTPGAFPVPPSGASVAGIVGGNGLVNNAPFSLSTANAGDQPAQGLQFVNTYNNGYYSRLKKYADVSYGTTQSLFGASASTGANATTIMTETQLQSEFKSYFKVLGTNYMVTYDTAIIRLADIMDSMKSLCLMKKFDGILRLYFNTGAVVSAISTVTAGSMVTSGSYNTFTNTCPLIQSCLAAVPTNTKNIVSGLFIAKATATSLIGVNLASSGASHPMTACRFYYPLITLKPEKLIPYISENRAKKIVYTSVLYNTFNAITSGSTYSALVQSGVTNPRGILILPFISSSTYGTVNTALETGVTTFAQIQSPYDQAPATNAPISLLNLQVSVGGSTVLAIPLNYTYENFLEQTTLYEKINQSDLGLSCGLINEQYWSSAYRAYYVDLTRGNVADSMTPRNINVTFTNNSNVTNDVMCFTEFYNQIIVDTETGIVNKD